MLRFLVIFLVLGISIDSYAGPVLIGAIYVSNENTDRGNRLDLTSDLRIGYEFDINSESSIGVLGVLERQKMGADGVGQELNGRGLALSFRKNNFYFLGSYLFDIENSSRIFPTELDGDGLKFDIGYGWSINDSTFIGPRLSFKSYEFENGQEMISYSRFQPMFGAFTRF